jgi:shikimate kinase
MRNIILTGFTGTGKTTIGQRLAQALDVPFVDMDRLIEERQGRAIREIFAQEGEPYFRQQEAEMCQELSLWQGYVIATGGGTLVNEDNLNVFASRENLVICLDCEARVVWRRLANANDRPLLDSTDAKEKRERIFALFEQRKEAYARIEQHIDTTSCAIEDIVQRIIATAQMQVEPEEHLLPPTFPPLPPFAAQERKR